ncbi:hypothetical protein [Pelagibacterium montanilacus]|uniref:hypothetical protein n=1 Tax=Pelagibacterium montanilacus TaxID=2185280 RepID=UPI000F8F69C6|nr:hypothetical protein [Pelagibacterium montanilacus]
MLRHPRLPTTNQSVCGQAEEISQILLRADSLPTPLHLSIEELLEGAWEIAFRKHVVPASPIIVELAHLRARRG